MYTTSHPTHCIFSHTPISISLRSRKGKHKKCNYECTNEIWGRKMLRLVVSLTITNWKMVIKEFKDGNRKLRKASIYVQWDQYFTILRQLCGFFNILKRMLFTCCLWNKNNFCLLNLWPRLRSGKLVIKVSINISKVLGNVGSRKDWTGI